MCGGGSKSADAYYEEMRPDPVDLPSLSAGKKSTRNTQYGNVKATKTGVQRRSLLSFFRSNRKDNS